MKKLSLLQLGNGNVGGKLVQQISDQKKNLAREFGVELVYCGLFNSQGGIFDSNGLDLTPVPNASDFSSSVSVEKAIAVVNTPFVLIDTTASDQTYPLLQKALARGGFAVLSNKKPLSGKQEAFDSLKQVGGKRLFYETVVGAGLPVIETLKTLLATGDEIIAIKGCFSGTLGFLFSELESGLPFSESVLKAKEQGFTEPNPRDDLSGMDVARKALILSRMLGSKIELSDIKLEGLYPKEMETISTEEFLTRLPELDGQYREKGEKAKAEEKVLRFVASVTKEGCSVGLEAVAKNSDIGQLAGPDNLIVFRTKRYNDNLLVVKGPGAGGEVTAAGVFGDLIKIIMTLGE
jgi:homoserine dehydrogenase